VAAIIGRANSEVGDRTSFGVLKLTLRPGGRDCGVRAGGSCTDSGGGTCN